MPEQQSPWLSMTSSPLTNYAQGMNQLSNAYGATASMMPQMQNQVMGMQSNQQMQANMYPSYPNGAGAGSQTAGQVPAAPSAPTASSPATPYSFSQGANPWSLSGEALSRGR
jgi:hypothetical protein